MNILLMLITTLGLGLTACTGGAGAGGGGAGGDDCRSDNCVCPADESCEHTCEEGAPECHVQGYPGRAVDVQCDGNGECHVECSQASSCTVDCGGSLDCDVSCPPSGCTVTSCVGDCDVSCGLAGRAPQSGSIATCP